MDVHTLQLSLDHFSTEENLKNSQASSGASVFIIRSLSETYVALFMALLND